MLAGTIVGWCAIGLITGLLARIVAPGRDPGGLPTTLLLGIAGAFLGGQLGRVLNVALLAGTSGAMVTGTAGAIVLLGLYRIALYKRST